MAATYCTFVPSKGNNLFKELRKHYDYPIARSVFLRAISPRFIEDYQKSLTLDEEGVPTYDSLMKNSYIKDFLGEGVIIMGMDREYKEIEDTRDNYNNALESAFQFNSNPDNSNYIATVESVGDSKIKVTIQKKDEASVKRFKEQWGTKKLQDRILEILKPLGVTIDDLTEAEVKAGRVGVTEFDATRNISTGLISLMRLANNMEGAQALPEEFSHFLVGIFRDKPLIQRAINLLKDNEKTLREVLGKDYDDTVEFHDGDMERVAEEALGHIIKDNMIKEKANEYNVESSTQENNIEEEQEVKSKKPLASIFKRVLEWIKKQFKGYSANSIQDTINQVDSLTSTLIRNVVDGSQEITRQDVDNSKRNARFNALSEKADRNINILKNAIKTEIKRNKILNNEESKKKTKGVIEKLTGFYQKDSETVQGIIFYAKEALDELKRIDRSLIAIDAPSFKSRSQVLLMAKSYLDSYGSFLQALKEASMEDAYEENNIFIQPFEVNGKTTTLKEVIRDLNELSDDISTRYTKLAFPTVAEFLKPFMGEEIEIPFGELAGKKMKTEDLLKKAESDISFTDRWLDAMANSSDVILQAYNAAVMKQKDKARFATIDFSKKVKAFMLKAESKGFKSFDWMFERDKDGNLTGNYISSVNTGQFQKDLEEFEKELKEKYGENPTGENAKKKIAEKREWLNTHAVMPFGAPIPHPTYYHNPAFDKLTSVQNSLYEEYLGLKDEMDRLLPNKRVDMFKAIQIRKDTAQRILDGGLSPSRIFENIKESIKEDWSSAADDDQLFGENVVGGLTDFSGKEFYTLPILYTNRLKNPNEISTDVIGSLLAYSYMANQYSAMNEVLEELELGYDLIAHHRKVSSTRGNRKVVEKIKDFGIEAVNETFLNESNIVQRLNDFRESQIYGRYLKDQGSVLKDKVNVNKAASQVLKMSSLAQLGFNWLANIANAATGVAMVNIEAAAGQFFNAKELAKADKEYAVLIPDFTKNLANRVKNDKLSLFFELLNVKQDFSQNIKREQRKNLFLRFFGPEVAFIGQQAGDHWLYGRVAIAMSLRQKVKVNGREMSLWEALKVINSPYSNDIKQLNKEDIKNVDGSDFDFGKFSRKVASVNQNLFGIYNDDDANAANRVAQGRLLQQYRKWMKPAFNKRFQAGQKNLATDTWDEGYYRTMFRIILQLKRGEVQLGALKSQLRPEERANLRRGIVELAQFFAVWAIANFIKWPDDKDRPYAIKLAEYTARRLTHELGTLAPSPYLLQEMLKTVKNPVPSTSVGINLVNLVSSACWPADWTDEIQTGPYKGLSTLEKNIIKAPFPFISYYKQIDKATHNIDTSTLFYVRPSY